MNPTVTVLYAEDEASDRLLMKIAFEAARLGDALRTVSDGKAAIEYLSGTGPYADRAQNPLPSLILLDLNMPQVTGFRVLEWVRAHPPFTALPVIIFTSSSRDADKAQAQTLGATEYIEKPSSITNWVEIVSRLKQTWKLSAPGNPLAASPP